VSDPRGHKAAETATLAIGAGTSPPTTTAASLRVTENAAATSIGIAAPTDPKYSASQLSVTVTGLPTDGTVLLSDGVTAVTSGEILTIAQLTGQCVAPARQQGRRDGELGDRPQHVAGDDCRVADRGSSRRPAPLASATPLAWCVAPARNKAAGAVDQIADRVLFLGRPPRRQIDQDRRPVGRVGVIGSPTRSPTDAEIIHLRTLLPLDIETVVDSVKKTGRCVIAHEAMRTCGYGAELAAFVQEHCFRRHDRNRAAAEISWSVADRCSRRNWISAIGRSP
jgi:hypothetical protein